MHAPKAQGVPVQGRRDLELSSKSNQTSSIILVHEFMVGIVLQITFFPYWLKYPKKCNPIMRKNRVSGLGFKGSKHYAKNAPGSGKDVGALLAQCLLIVLVRSES